MAAQASTVQGEAPHAVAYAESSRVEDSVSGDEWIGTLGGGLLRRSAGRIDVFDQMNSGLPGNFVFSVVAAGGLVFAATNGGTCSFEPFMEEWDVFDPRRSDQPQSAVVELRWIHGDLLGRLWGVGVRRWDPESHRWVQTEHTWLQNVRGSVPADPDSESPSWSVAVLGPGTRRMPLPGDESWPRRPVLQPDLLAAQAAVARVNLRGGLANEPAFATADATPGYARYGWSLLEDDLVTYARTPGVLGAVAYLDDRSSYTEAAAALLGFPLVGIDDWPASVRSAEGAEPWTFRCRGEELRTFQVLFDRLARTEQCRRWAIVVDATQSEARTWAQWTRNYAKAHALPEPALVEWQGAAAELAAGALQNASPQAIFLWAAPGRAAVFCRALRDSGSTAWIIVSPEAINPDFVQALGSPVEGVLAPAPSSDSTGHPNEPMSAKAVSERTAMATEHLLAAMGVAGGDRRRVRDALARMEEDILGEEHVEPAEAPSRSVRIARLIEGRWQYQTVSPAQP